MTLGKQCLAILVFGISFITLAGKTPEFTFDSYHSPDEVASMLRYWAKQYPSLTKLIPLSKNKNGLAVIRVAAQKKGAPDPDSRPGIFISANLEGVHLIGTEAALMIVNKLLAGYGTDEKITSLLEKRTVYAAPLLNPAAASHFFTKPRYECLRNDFPVDDDLDDVIDEDGPEDLNNDGLITLMRVKVPEGKWIPDPKEPRLMKKAVPEKGETGVYKIYTEGLDNDGDGNYNEDPAGGIELNRNFPHDFEYWVRDAGLWPVSAEETISLVKFLISHANIAMVLNFSSENTILNLKQTGKAKAAGNKVKIPRQFASFLGLDPDTKYSLTEIVNIIKDMGIGGGMEIDESMVAQFLGLGPAVTIDKQDLPFFEAVQEEYKKALKDAKINYPLSRAKGVGRGSFVAYCYFQLGVQVFSTDLWLIPEPEKKTGQESLTVEKLKTMSSEDFLSLGEEKIQAFLEKQGAPPNFKASMLIKMLKERKITPSKMADMIERMPKKKTSLDTKEHPDSYVIKWSDSVLKGKGFVPWTHYNHPTLGDVEIGGFVPYLKTTPPPEDIKKTISFHADFYLKLMDKLAELKVKQVEVKALDENFYKVTCYLENTGWFPTSTAQGRRARTSWPITVRVKISKGQSIFSGRPVEEIPFLNGRETRKLEWTIKADKNSKITITAHSPKLGSVKKTVVLK